MFLSSKSAALLSGRSQAGTSKGHLLAARASVAVVPAATMESVSENNVYSIAVRQVPRLRKGGLTPDQHATGLTLALTHAENAKEKASIPLGHV